MDALAEAHRPIVRLRDQWVLVDPELVRKARKRELGLLRPGRRAGRRPDRHGRGGRRDGGGGARRARWPRLRDRLTAGSGPAAAARRPGRHPARLPAARPGLAGPDDLARPRRLPRRRHGPRQDGHADRAAPAPGPPRARRWSSARPPCWATGSGRSPGSPPACPVRRFHGADRTLDDLDGGFVLTTYGTMRSSARPTGRAAPGAWSSPTRRSTSRTRYSATAKALRTIPAPARVALTGTPVENNLSELWALLDWTTPGLLGPLKSFRARHARAVENRRGRGRRSSGWPGWSGPSCCAARSPTRASCPSCRPRRRPTTRCRSPANRPRCTRRWCARRWRPSRPREGIARRGLVMKLLTALKQICNHPAQYLKEEHAPGRRRPRRPLRQTRPARRTAGHHPRRGRLRPGLHPVRRHGPPAHRAPRRPRGPRRSSCTAARPWPSGSAWWTASRPARSRSSCCP